MSIKIIKESDYVPKGDRNPAPSLLNDSAYAAHDFFLNLRNKGSFLKDTLVRNTVSICRDVINIINDDKWLSLLSESFGVASHIAYISACPASQIIPYVSMISTPIYLYSSIQESRERIHMMSCAIKASRVSDFFFWGAKTAGPLGNFINDIVKPFAGGMALFGLIKIPAIGFTFTYLIPVILMVFSSVAGGAQGWSLLRSLLAFHQFKQKKDNLGNELAGIQALLRELQGPTEKRGEKTESESASYKLDEKQFKETHFTCNERYQAIQSRIQKVVNYNDRSQIQFLEQQIAELIPIIQQGQEAVMQLQNPDLPLSDQIDSAVEFCEKILKKTEIWEGVSSEIQDLIRRVEEGKSRVLELKDILRQEGANIAGAMKLEIGSKIIEELVNIIAMSINFAAGLLFITVPQLQLIGYILSLSASLLGAFGIITSKVAHCYLYPTTENFNALLKRKDLVHKALENYTGE